MRKIGLALMGLATVCFLSLSAQANTAKQSENKIAVIHADGDDSAFHSARIGTLADNIIRITPNKSKILRLERDAASVIVSNPTHASVILDTPRLLVIVPRVPGATSFTVLDARGNLIIERDVVVTGTENNYIHVRRMCAGDDRGCMPQSVYFCPDACYQVATQLEDDGGLGGGGGSGGGSGGAGGGGGYAADDGGTANGDEGE